MSTSDHKHQRACVLCVAWVTFKSDNSRVAISHDCTQFALSIYFSPWKAEADDLVVTLR